MIIEWEGHQEDPPGPALPAHCLTVNEMLRLLKRNSKLLVSWSSSRLHWRKRSRQPTCLVRQSLGPSSLVGGEAGMFSLARSGL